MGIYIKSILIAAGIGAATYVLPVYNPELGKGSYVMEVFFTIFGAVYAIIAGFVMLVVLNNHSDVRHSVRMEVNALRRLRDFLRYVDDKDAVADVRQKIRNYGQSVIQKEWVSMVSRKKTLLATSSEVHDLMDSVGRINPEKANNSHAIGKIFDAVSDVITYRSDRLGASREKLPPMLKFLVFILSVFLMFIFTLMPIEMMILRVVFNVINAFALTYIYLIILDLNNPFRGNWNVTPERMENFLKKVD